MDYYAGMDVSLELSSVCILDASGQTVSWHLGMRESDSRRVLTLINEKQGPLSHFKRQF
jgi:hypothetical protein